MSVHESHPIVDCDRRWRLADARLLAWATRRPRREVFLHRRRRRERDLLWAREVAVTDPFVDLGAERRHEAAAYEAVGGSVWVRHDLEHGILFQERVVC